MPSWISRAHEVRHTTETSSLWLQSLSPQEFLVHRLMSFSLPLQRTSSSQILPLPWPYAADPLTLLTPAYPSILQTTAPSGVPNESSQIVPHSPLCNISTRPTLRESPVLTKRMSRPITEKCMYYHWTTGSVGLYLT